MLRQANVQNTFSYREEEGQNPYIGFVSYQHFRGEALYSDAVVRPENNMTETEAFECYPIPEEWQEQIRSWSNQMGYHFVPKSFSYPEQALAGDTLELTLPEELPVGSYVLELGIVGEATPMIYLCTDAERNGRFYRLGTLTTKEKKNV